MIRGTTNSKAITVEYDLSSASEIHVTIAQGNKVIDTTDVTLVSHTAEESVIKFALTEAQSLSLKAGRAKIQANWIVSDSGTAVRMATKAVSVPYLEQLLDEEILSPEPEEETEPEEENNG